MYVYMYIYIYIYPYSTPRERVRERERNGYRGREIDREREREREIKGHRQTGRERAKDLIGRQKVKFTCYRLCIRALSENGINQPRDPPQSTPEVLQKMV